MAKKRGGGGGGIYAFHSRSRRIAYAKLWAFFSQKILPDEDLASKNGCQS